MADCSSLILLASAYHQKWMGTHLKVSPNLVKKIGFIFLDLRKVFIEVVLWPSLWST
jgi:hypothetical protein